MWKFWIDTGGTFTDCLALSPSGEERRVKVLSSGATRMRVVDVVDGRTVRMESPFSAPAGFFVGYDLRLHDSTGVPARVIEWTPSSGEAKLDADVEGLKAGSLCSLQSPEEPPLLGIRQILGLRLDEALPPVELRLATTRGTNALLEAKGAKTALFVTRGFKDLLKIGTQQRPDLFELGIKKREPLHALVFEVIERLDKNGQVIEALDEDAIRESAKRCRTEGVESAAVALLHSYRNPAHESRVGEILREEGVDRVSLSSELSPKIKILPRAETAVVDAYLAPIMDAYLDSVQQNLPEKGLKVMTSAGGLVTRSHYRPKDSLLSGPAGGVVGSSSIARRAGFDRGIAFDMGGTSTDVSRFDGSLDYQYEQEIGGAKVFAPSLRIKTVAAGGGSLCGFDGSALRVGPESAGALPGPACYGAGGGLTITDVNLLLGRIDASKFGIPIFPEASGERFKELVHEIRCSSEAAVVESDVLQGLLNIANERMAEAIRSISLREGYDPKEYALIAFGGAGGLHACAIADILEMDTILFPADAGLLSSHGLREAKVEGFEERQVLKQWNDCRDVLENWKEVLITRASEALLQEGEEPENLEVGATQIEMRFLGQETGLLIDFDAAAKLENDFRQRFESQYGFVPEQPIEVVSLKVSVRSRERSLECERFATDAVASKLTGNPHCSREELRPGECVQGPISIQDRFSTVYVDEGWQAVVGDCFSLKLVRREKRSVPTGSSLEAVELELHTNRFLSLVEEMGNLLERSAFSTNVKERKDFSCALLDTDGCLVANAPHIPVHLGALGVCVRSVVAELDLEPGDVVLTNHPGYGGSHLPDLTLITPVHTEEGVRVGYVANRAHHAELGGVAPGSMPPQATSLEEEGIVFPPTHFVRRGSVDWPGIKKILTSGRYPTRRLEENVSDLAAQLAAIRFGAEELLKMVRNESLGTVQHFMGQIKARAATALRDSLQRLPWEFSEAEERLDNGASIVVRVQRSGSKWLVDFTGSAAVQKSNYNATPAIVTSAVIYVLRLIANQSIPLNEGFLEIVDLQIPEGMLSPRFDADPSLCPPVVAGNVEVSQRIVDTLLKAFGLAACSQGTMNNLIYGNDKVSYYETIAGGEGATMDSKGADGVHTHMTNTGITDPEVLEFRFPVRLEQFELREGSGGFGLNRGGDGLCRRIRFLESVTVSLLTQHRIEGPYGLDGGGAGALGRQCKIGTKGEREELPGNGTFPFQSGEAIELLTPGGGGWGRGDV